MELGNEQRKIEQILATPTEMWDMTRKIRRAMRRRGQQEFELNGKQVHQFITFWRGLYQTHTPPKLEKRDYEVKIPSEHQIKNLIKHMPSRKAPGPD